MNIYPTLPQYRHITSPAKFPAMVAGFGAGKTDAAIVRSIVGKLRFPKQDRGFYEPTWDLVRMIAFPRFEEKLTQMGVSYRLYKSPLNYIEVHGAGKIFFRSMEVPEKLVGYEHADADVDEIDILKTDHAAHAWRQIVARNRQKKPDASPNSIGVTTTPEGFRFVYNTWAKNPAPGYQLIKAPTESNTHLPEDYVQSLRDIYTGPQVDAYLMGEFVNLTSGSVYPDYNREQHRSRETIQCKEPLHVGMDFNVGKMSAILHVMRPDGDHAAKEHLGVRDTPGMIELLRSTYEGHRIFIYPDASGAAATTSNASISDLRLLHAAGFDVKAPKKNPFVKDRVHAFNARIRNGQYRVNDAECPKLADSLEQQAYDKNGAPDKGKDLDHPVDAAGYFVFYNYPLTGRPTLRNF